MTTAVQHRRGTTAEHATFTGLEGEVTIDTTKDTAVVHDGVTAGGVPLARENLSNVSTSGLSSIDGASTASDDKFFIYDQSATTLKTITRAELNNAIEQDALANVAITGGTINGTTIGGTTAAAGSFTTVGASGQITSTVADGTAPMVVTSTTKVSNLNVDKLDGADWAAPAAIGSGAPAAGAFTTLSASSTVSGSGFSSYLASPPAIGGTTPAAVSATTLSVSSTMSVTGAGSIQGLTVGRGAGSVATNTALGSQSLYSNTSASNNTSIGFKTLYTNSTGTSNTAMAVDALGLNTTGSYNVAIGNASLASNTTASNNTAVGYQAGYTNSVGTNNVYIGKQAGYNATGSGNTFVGPNGCGSVITTGEKNTIIGAFNGYTGLDISTASNYIVLSDGDGNPRGVFDSSGNLLVGTTSALNSSAKVNVYNTSGGNGGLAIGYGSGAAANRIIYLISSNGGLYFESSANAAYLNSAGAWTNASDARLKNSITDIKYGLSAVLSTQPRSYKMNDLEGDYIGFVAQELQAVIPEVVSGDPEKQLGVDYGSLVAVAFKAIQELKAEFDAYKEAHP